MKITRQTNQKVEIQLSIQESKVLRNVFSEVKNALSQTEFETRVGFSTRQAQDFLESISQKIESPGKSLIDISCSLDEITLLNNLLNEVCHGIKVHDFENKVAISEKEAKDFLKYVNKTMNEMKLFLQDDKTSYTPPQSIFPTSENNCFLEADGYRVTFYFKRLASIKDSVGMFIVLNFDSSDFIQFVISSVPKTISFEDLGNFIKELDKYTALTEQDIKGSAIPFQVFRSSLFQVQVIERGVTSNSEEYLNLNFMLSSAQARGNIVQPFIGVQGAVTLTNLRTFILSMREVLIDLSK